MKNSYQHLGAASLWTADNVLSRQRFDGSSLDQLVLDQGSLTSALIRLSDGNFEVRVLRQVAAKPYAHEQKKMNRPYHRVAIIREVELLLFGEPVVFARTIIPFNLVGNRLRHLGKTPLGHLLFKNGQIDVNDRDFAFISHEHKTIKARRTPYAYQGETILVSEFFLPSIEKLL